MGRNVLRVPTLIGPLPASPGPLLFLLLALGPIPLPSCRSQMLLLFQRLAWDAGVGLLLTLCLLLFRPLTSWTYEHQQICGDTGRST